MQKYSEIVATTKADGTVEVLPGATVTVYLTGTTTLATLYSDNGITAKANPFQSAALTGRIEFYAADGRYDIKIDKAGYTTVTVADILIEDPEDIGILEDVTLVDATISTSTVTNSTLSQCILVNTEIQDVDSLQLTNTPPAVLQPRMMAWNETEGTADLALLDGTVLQMGQELHYRARNNTASTIADGAVVWATGTTGATGRINVGLAVADGSQPGKTVMGLMTHATAAGSDGYVANFGKVRGINTTGSAVGETWLNGDILYLHPTIPGALTKVKPAVNGHIVVTVAIVIYAGNNGTLFVRPTADSQEADEIRYTPAGTGAVATTVQNKLRENVSVLDFYANGVSGAAVDPTGIIDSTAGIQAALNVGGVVRVPAGIYKVQSLTVSTEVELIGDGSNKSIIKFYTTTDDGLVWNGDSSIGLKSAGSIRGIQFKYQGSGTPSKSGVKLTRKVDMLNVIIDGFSGHGLEFLSVNAGTQTPYFCNIQSVRSINNGLSGCRVRDNCNANTFVNCEFNSNGQYGFHQELSSLATYNTTIIGGQASYNQRHGWYFANCTNYNVFGAYAEYNNQSATGASAGDTLNGTYKDLYIGDNVTYSNIHFGAFINQQIGRARLNTQSSVQVWQGSIPAMGFPTLALGQQGVGSGTTFTFNGAGGSIHNLNFREGANDGYTIRYNGTYPSPTNRIMFVPKVSGVEGTPPLQMMNNGNIGFFGATPIAKPTVTGSRGGNAALASLITQLSNIGLLTDSTTV